MRTIDDKNTSKPQINSAFPVEKKPFSGVSNIYGKDMDYDIEALYKYKYFTMVYRCCRKIFHNHEDAEDMAQNVFEKLLLLKKEGRLEILSPRGPGGLLAKMAANMSFTRLSRVKEEYLAIYKWVSEVNFAQVRNMELGEIWNLLKSNSVGEYVDKKNIFMDGSSGLLEAELFVKALLEDQDEKMLEICFLRYRDGLTLEEIGRFVGLKKSAVEKRLKKIDRLIALKLGKGIK
jgi:RNA polymerase sigma factor (sigma-70 family)